MQNTYNHPPTPKESNTDILPAIAVRAQGDKCAFIECGFKGVQDTLYDHSGRHYYHKCYIQGGIDFIWGDARSMYEVINQFILVHNIDQIKLLACIYFGVRSN